MERAASQDFWKDFMNTHQQIETTLAKAIRELGLIHSTVRDGNRLTLSFEMPPIIEFPDFEPFVKIARLSREIIITEKIDGTNAQVFIDEAGNIFAGSRTRWLQPSHAVSAGSQSGRA